jgi:hypothetical protein
MSQWHQWNCFACHSGVNGTALHATAVSVTLLCMSQRCHWHRGFRNSNCIQNLVVSMAPMRKSQQSQWHHCACHSIVNAIAVHVTNDAAAHITAVSLTLLCNKFKKNCVNNTTLFFLQKSDYAAHGTAVSMTLLCLSQWCQWHWCTCHSIVIDTLVV